MNTGQHIRYLRRQDINDAAWDQCIAEAANGLIYGYSFYLDQMAGNWDALVLDDYEAVMPLPWRQKWGITYIYQPFLTAQLGVFGNQLSENSIASFLKAVPKKFRYWDFPLNHQNRFAATGFPLYERMNYVLPLQQSYEVLYRGYRENSRRNIKKSLTYGCQIVKDVDVGEIAQLAGNQSGAIEQADLNHFATLFDLLEQKGMAETYGISSDRGQLLASAAFLFSHRRAYYIFVGNHPNGRTLGASHTLIDAFIRDHADQDLWLDFEGSDLRNLAFFYRSFGAQEERYAAIQLNRLPWWIKWMK